MIITITIPDVDATEFIQDYADEQGWNSGLGVTRSVFAKQQIIHHAKSVVRLHRMKEAAAAASATAAATVDPINIT